MKVEESRKFKRDKKSLSEEQSKRLKILYSLLRDSSNFQEFCNNKVTNFSKYDFKKRQDEQIYSFRLDNKICRLFLSNEKDEAKVILIEIDKKKIK